jgi:hypothetical protein
MLSDHIYAYYWTYSSSQGKHGKTPLGDLSTVICSYDDTQGYSSNSLSSYFHDLGWRARAHDLVTSWLGQQSDSLGGNYGEPTPSDLGFDITAAGGGADATCSASPDPTTVVYSNSLSVRRVFSLIGNGPLGSNCV